MSATAVRVGTSLFFLLLFGSGAYAMAQERPLAGGFPLAICLVGTLLAAVSLGVEAVNTVQRRRGTLAPDGSADADTPDDPSGSESGVGTAGSTEEELRFLRRATFYFGWTIGFLGAVWLLGGLLGAWVFLTAFFILETKARPGFWIVGPIGAVATLWFLERALRTVEWPEGFLQLL